MTDRKEEGSQSAKEIEPQSRYLRIGIIGPIGSGKSTLADVLGERWSGKVIHENYQDNPHLEDFYNAETPPFLISQLWFLQAKISKLKEHSGQQLEIWDPALEMDFLYSRTLREMGHLSQEEYELYEGMAEALSFEADIFEPDLFIVVNASPKQLVERIQARSRVLERAIDPIYVSRLSEIVSRWTLDEKGRKSIFEIDSGYYNFAKPGESQASLLGRIESRIADLSLNNPFSKDGYKLNFPSFSPPAGIRYDIPPGMSSEERVIRQR